MVRLTRVELVSAMWPFGFVAQRANPLHYRRIKLAHLAGLEPAILWVETTCVVHCATDA